MCLYWSFLILFSVDNKNTENWPVDSISNKHWGIVISTSWEYRWHHTHTWESTEEIQSKRVSYKLSWSWIGLWNILGWLLIWISVVLWNIGLEILRIILRSNLFDSFTWAEFAFDRLNWVNSSLTVMTPEHYCLFLLYLVRKFYIGILFKRNL